MTRTVADRIQERLEDLDLKAQTASILAGLGKSGVRNILDGASKHPRTDTLAKLAPVLKTSIEWLARERGPKHVESEGAPPEFDEGNGAAARLDAGRRHATKLTPGAIPEFDVRAGASYGGGFSEPTVAYDDESGRSFAANVVKAEWVFPSGYLREELRVRLDDADILPVEGPSMDDGSIYALRSGDRVLINRGDIDCRQGAIFAVWDGFGVVIKQVELLRGSEPPRILCTSLNKSYSPFELILDGNAHIIGRVICKIARV